MSEAAARLETASEGAWREELRRRLEAVFLRVEAACRRVGRDPREVRVLPVTKGVGVPALKAILELGAEELGESRVQELMAKVPELPGARWHFVGYLQTNKAKKVMKTCVALHSLDRPSLLEELEVQGERLGKEMRAFVEVNVAGEASKHGLSPRELPDFLDRAAGCRWVRVVGLMTVAPAVRHPEDVRWVFRELARLRERAAREHPEVTELSMGMSDDFEVAVEEGATVVRIGRAIFGGRA